MPVITASSDSNLHPKSLDTAELLPIREVSRMTGINPVTLRAWERRYGLIQPVRTESGHRLYSKADITTINRILDWIERGVAVSKVGKILARDDQQALAVRAEQDSLEGREWAQWQMQMMQAVSAFDDRRLEHQYARVLATYPLSVAFQDILMPLWHELLRHQGRFGQASEWLFFDNFLRVRALQRLQLACAAPVPRVLLAAIPGECRKLELLVAALLMGAEDLAVKVLAVGQPLDELTLICEKTHPQALIVFSNRAHNQDLVGRLNRLAQTLDCPLLIAGDASDLAEKDLVGSSVGCLGSEGRLMQRRLQQYLSGTLDT
ncbi:MerR family transcriptional regulator [Pseudomonas allii]|uniref:MerR family transcriptional regulator n=2 Tax=Pseudomonas allii TaxID=2740531 RepID=A0ACC6LHL4_9PSED|nr:MerR family transcriptional regulator [Pseudomonas allii]KTB58474.1 MerR family transcriptional regulator [Pseudomonas fluorescens]MDR9877778.1 MerR family transcriptional regulator [Pseudomonas allii]NWN50422.1 MerR family transcriptional regulator [Pseudomonas allii]NWN63792.1 MerR family transcriptional regulator [Pseudomonas allii]